MILVDTSAWVEFLRDTGSRTCEETDRLLEAGAAVTEPVAMEVLAGARNDQHLRQLRGLLGRAQLLHCTPKDFDTAALLYRTCRGNGATVRRLVDCLIGAVAIRTGSPVLYADRDFNVLARHVGLAVHPSSLAEV